jgi:hypothetical protein
MGDLPQQRSVSLGPLLASFEVNCRRFEISTQRPEAHSRDAKPKAEP